MKLSEKAIHYFKTELEENHCKTLVVNIIGSCCSEGEDIRLEYSNDSGNYTISGIPVLFTETEYQELFDRLLMDVKNDMVVFDEI